MIKLHDHINRTAGFSFRAVLTAISILDLASSVSAGDMKGNREFNDASVRKRDKLAAKLQVLTADNKEVENKIKEVADKYQ